MWTGLEAVSRVGVLVLIALLAGACAPRPKAIWDGIVGMGFEEFSDEAPRAGASAVFYIDDDQHDILYRHELDRLLGVPLDECVADPERPGDYSPKHSVGERLVLASGARSIELEYNGYGYENTTPVDAAALPLGVPYSFGVEGDGRLGGITETDALRMPDHPDVITPDLTSEVVVANGVDLEVTWTAGVEGDALFLWLAPIELLFLDAYVCRLMDDGHFVVPGSVVTEVGSSGDISLTRRTVTMRDIRRDRILFLGYAGDRGQYANAGVR